MKYPRILSAIRSARWAITPPTLQAISDTLGAHLRGDLRVSTLRPRAKIDIDDPEEPCEAAPPRSMLRRGAAGPAVLPIHGIIGKHLSALEMECGGVDVDAISAALDEAVADATISAVFLDIDSPGGVVTGVPELAAKIRRIDAAKAIYAYTSGQCCSAAYWLASAARAIYAAPSSDLGSIGVYVALVDDSEWWKKEGYKLELIKAGEYKAMGISGKPLSDDERSLIQADVDAIYAKFTADILARRPSVASSTMQGQTFMGETALALHLIDALHDDLTSALQSLNTMG